MPELITATDPHGVVHKIDGNTTICGRNAAGWSRHVTTAQLAGLVVFCEKCHA